MGKSSTGNDFRDEIERLEAEQAAFLASLEDDGKVIAGRAAEPMGGGDQNALVEALRPLIEQHGIEAFLHAVVEQLGRERIEQALRQISPPARGRPKGTAPYLNSDEALMLAAYDEFLRMYTRFHRDLAGRHPRPTTHGALMRVAKRAFERREYDGSLNTPEALARRLDTRFKKESAT